MAPVASPIPIAAARIEDAERRPYHNRTWAEVRTTGAIVTPVESGTTTACGVGCRNSGKSDAGTDDRQHKLFHINLLRGYSAIRAHGC
jgi:hypothetical protein